MFLTIRNEEAGDIRYPPVGGGAFNGNVWVDPKLLTIHSRHESEETRGIIKYFTDQTAICTLSHSQF